MSIFIDPTSFYRKIELLFAIRRFKSKVAQPDSTDIYGITI